MASIAESGRPNFNLRKFLARDPGILGRAAKTVWIDRTPMKDRIEGVTNSTNPQEGGAMTRRDFLKLGVIAGLGTAAGEFLAACARWTGQPTQVASATDSAPATLPAPTKPAVELGIQYDEVAVLDEASAVAEMAKIGIPLDLAYAGAIKEFQDAEKFPQLKLAGARYDKFAIVVPYVGMDEKKLRYIYPFIGVEAVDPNSSFVAIMIPQYNKQGTLTGFAVESLEATEVEFAGAKRGALSIFKDPATGADISPRPVFIYPTDIAGWRQMTDAQRKAQAIIFIPYNLPSPKEIRITGGKLAKLVVDMATATPEPKPTETKQSEPTPEPWHVKTAAEYNQILKSNKIIPVNWSGRLDGYLQVGKNSTDIINGLNLDLSTIAGLKLIDYDANADPLGKMDLVFTYSYAGKTNFLHVTYNACKPDKINGSYIHRLPLKIGQEYSLALLSANRVDAPLVADTIGGGEACQQYAELTPIKVETLKQEVVSNSGNFVDLDGEVIAYQIN
mgnify:CR=1 FL=1